MGVVAAGGHGHYQQMQFYDLEQDMWEVLPDLKEGTEAKFKTVNDVHDDWKVYDTIGDLKFSQKDKVNI